jgi:hypothetical protein
MPNTTANLGSSETEEDSGISVLDPLLACD